MRSTIFIYLFCLTVSFCHAQLVLPGDHPDPSVTRIGDTYWASATTSNWIPAYPLLSSKDLIHWENKGFVFTEPPAWADYYFWAPEISHENGITYVYYSAHRKDGNLCLGIASAENPEGPYRDHGPMMCQDVGSIDAFPMRDENGKLFLIWKEDGNSVGRPTPIWMSELKEDRSGLTGDKIELFRNDAPWESNLVEGVSMIRHGEYFYAFYAAAGCCGRDCTYATGIARSKKLSGPWEKYSNNPVMTNDEKWKCPGHGTPIEKDGKFYFLYHAYEKDGSVYAGRQGLLREFEFTTDGWVRFLPYSIDNVEPENIRDEFDGSTVNGLWQHSVFTPARFEQTSGKMAVFGSESGVAYIAQKSYVPNYRARIKVDISESSAGAGIAAVGDEKNIVGIYIDGNKLTVWKTRLGKDTVIVEEDIVPGEHLYLEMKVEDGNRITFRCSRNGRSFKAVTRKPVDGAFLPPWDRAVRIGLISRGGKDQKAVFENFILYH
jgi:xylan 1,4-beta-xylosidase